MKCPNRQTVYSILPPLIILALAFLIFSRTGIEGVFKKADNPFPFYASESAYRDFYQWGSQFHLGNPSSLSTIYLFPMDAFVLLCTHLGIPIGLTERIYFVLMFACMGWSFYYLMGVLLPASKNRIPRLIASVLYMFNPYVLANLAHGQTGILMALAIAPLSIGLFFRGLVSKSWKGRIKNAVLISLVNSLWVQGHIVIALISLVLFACMFIYVTLSDDIRVSLKARLRQNLGYLCMAGILTLLLNLWWLVPYGRTYLSETEINWSTALSSSVVEASSSLARLSEVGRLIHGYLPYMSFNSSWIEFWQSAAGALIGFCLVAIVFSSLLMYKYSKFIALFGLLAVGSTIMAMGTKPPFGILYGFLFDHIPFFDVNRRPQNFQFLQIFSCAVLLGFVASWACSRFAMHASKSRTVMKVIFICLICALIFSYSWPMMTGNLDGQLKGIVIPESYEQAREWEKETDISTSRVLAIPTSDGYVRYTWMPDNPHQEMGDPLGELLAKPVVVELPQGGWVSADSKQIVEALQDSISDNNSAYTNKLLAMCNIGYVLVRYDMVSDIPDAELERIESNLESNEEISLAESFGQLHFYKLDDQYSVPRIYPASNAIAVNGGMEQLLEQGQLDSLVVSESAIFMSNNLSPSQWQFINGYNNGSNVQPPEISFKMINPTKYQVKVVKATGPFLLVFSESYHDQWKAYMNPEGNDTNWMEAFWQRPISTDRHFLVNGYANAWYVDPAGFGVGKDFTITIYYTPQSLFYAGLIVSVLTLVGCVGYLILDWGKRRVRRGREQ